MVSRSRIRTRLTQFFLLFVGCLVLVTFVATRFHTTKVSADVKGVETFECDPDIDTVVFQSGPVDITGSCTSAMITLDNNHFKLKDAKGPVDINRQQIIAGTDQGPGHSYYLMIFWED
jgi:hypothetical protein